MAQPRVTLKEIMTAVRELTFDRFIIPAFALKATQGGDTITITRTVIPANSTNAEKIEGSVTLKVGEKELSYSFDEYPTMDDLLNALQNEGVVLAYTPYFRGVEPTSALLPLEDRDLASNLTLFRRYFFDDAEIVDMIRTYYMQVLDFAPVYFETRNVDDDLVGRLKRPSEKHLTLWVAYHIVEKRRLYEQAAGAIGQTFTDGSDYVGSDLSQGAGTTVTTQIGSVFTVTEDPSRGFFYEDFNRVGSDNVLGDRYSFWYKLQLWLRDQLEEMFGDTSLRKDNVISGYVSLARELDFRSYYDSYPFTLSPLSRGIVSKVP